MEQIPKNLSLELHKILASAHKEVQRNSEIYKISRIPKGDGRYRILEIPNREIKLLCRELVVKVLQKIEQPSYCFSGWKNASSIENALKHSNNINVVTMDIKDFFRNTRSRFVEKFATDVLNLQDLDLDIFLKITTFRGHLPTGSPTSPILSCLVHKQMFDSINSMLDKNQVTFSLYMDDITISSKHRIDNWVIKHINSTLKTHCLWLNRTKTKRYGYKGANIVGIRKTQSGKLVMPFKVGHSIIKDLENTDIETMNLKQLMKLLGKIGYFRKLHSDKFIYSKEKARNGVKSFMRYIKQMVTILNYGDYKGE